MGTAFTPLGPRLIALIIATISGWILVISSIIFIPALFTPSVWEAGLGGPAYIICNYIVFFGLVCRVFFRLNKFLAGLVWIFSFALNLTSLVRFGMPIHWDNWDVLVWKYWLLFGSALTLLGLTLEFVSGKKTPDV